MNKMVATTLEAKFHVFDLRTHHPQKGFTSLTEKVQVTYSNLWAIVSFVIYGIFYDYFDSITLNILHLQLCILCS